MIGQQIPNHENYMKQVKNEILAVSYEFWNLDTNVFSNKNQEKASKHWKLKNGPQLEIHSCETEKLI